jgi:integrase
MATSTKLVLVPEYDEATVAPLLISSDIATVAPGQPESASQDGTGSMARRRYQTGRVFVRGKKQPMFVGRWREDVIVEGNQTIRVERSVVLGSIAELKTKKNAQRALQPFLDKVNSLDYRPAKFAKFEDLADLWETQILALQKPSSVKAAQSHLRTYIRPWLGHVRLEDFTCQAQQNFVTRLSGSVSRKTVLNVLCTLSSMLNSAKKWNYCCHPIDMRDLALPADQIRKTTRFFNGEEAKKIIMLAAEPYRTMFAIAAMTGLRAGEVMGLQKADLDFERRIILVSRSAWYGKVQAVKSRASRAPVVMSEALVTVLKEYLASWRENSGGFLFLNRNGRPYAANKVVEYGLWPVLDKLKIARAGMHAFRHCHASLLMDVGANPKVAQQQMRHADARTTLEAYAHVIGDAQREAVDRVGERLRPDAKCAQLRPN